MVNTQIASREYLIYGLCLPLAVIYTGLFFLFGATSVLSNLVYLAGLVGMTVSLNGEIRDSAQSLEFEAIPDMAVTRTGGNV